MNKQTLTDIYVAMLSGIAEYKNKKEIKWVDEENNPVTIEYTSNPPVAGNVIVRYY